MSRPPTFEDTHTRAHTITPTHIETHPESHTCIHSNMQNDCGHMCAYTRGALWGEHTHRHVCPHRHTVSSNTHACALLEQFHQCEQAWGQRHCFPCGPRAVPDHHQPPRPQPALPEPRHLLFLRHILSLCPFLNSVLPPGSAGTLLFSQLSGANSQGERKALLRGRVPNALSHR